MYPLASNTDLSFLEGVELLQVCVGVNEVILNFDRNVRLTILSDFTVQSPSGVPTRYRDGAGGTMSLLALLGNNIERAAVIEGGNLALTFHDGHRLELLDTSREYESFWISDGERTIVV